MTGWWLRCGAAGGDRPPRRAWRTEFSAPVLIDDAVLGRAETLEPLAPLHQPNNLAPIKAIPASATGDRQVACFDTAFHRRHPEVADRYAIPELYQEGVRRYGFHGLSYEYVAHRLTEIDPSLAEGRVVVCHLGSGASMCAIQAGCSVDSTMGFTAVDGLPMGTRPASSTPASCSTSSKPEGQRRRAGRALPLP